MSTNKRITANEPTSGNAGVSGTFDTQGLAQQCGAFRFVHKAPGDPPSYTRFTDAQLATFVERIRTAGVDVPGEGKEG